MSREPLAVYGDELWAKAFGAAWRGKANYFGDEIVRVYNRHTVHVNISKFQLVSAINQRPFDIAACGGFVLTDERECLHELFSADEVVVYRDPDELADPIDDLPLDSRGHFSQLPADWGNPERDLSQRQFFEVLELCTDKLPAAQGRAFMMREWLELSVEEICKELGVTSTNLYVLLHRARLRLRECMELNWFGQQQPARAPR